jgi:hypothetical protein
MASRTGSKTAASSRHYSSGCRPADRSPVWLSYVTFRGGGVFGKTRKCSIPLATGAVTMTRSAVVAAVNASQGPDRPRTVPAGALEHRNDTDPYRADQKRGDYWQRKGRSLPPLGPDGRSEAAVERLHHLMAATMLFRAAPSHSFAVGKSHDAFTSTKAMPALLKIRHLEPGPPKELRRSSL